MSLEGFRPISNDKLGSLLSRIKAEAIPYGSSALAKNIRFKAKGVQTRNGLSLTCQLPSNYKVTGAGVLAQPSLNPPAQIPLFFGSDNSSSELFREAPAGGGISGIVSSIASGLSANMFADISTAYSRAFIAYGSLLVGVDDPRQYDGTHYDPVGVDPQVAPVTLVQGASGGNVEAGIRYAVVLYLTRHGYISGITSASISSYTGADGAHKIQVTGIPVSTEPSVSGRIIAFTTAGADQAGPYFYIPEDDVVQTIAITSTVINDNTSTSAEFNFTDVYLQGASDISSPQDFFDKIKLPKQTSCYFSPTTRRMVWSGGDDDATIFRVSEADDPETYLGSTGFVKPSQNDGERAICAREFRSQLYLFKETAGFLTYNDAVNPSDWTCEKRWDRVGPVGPWAVDSSEAFMIFLDQSGVYKMDGSLPVCISDEISSIDSKIWSTINFQVKQKFWVFIDTDLDEIHCGVATQGSTEVNRILKCNYLLGFTPGSRKWSFDTIPTTRMLKLQRNLPICPNPSSPLDPRIAITQIVHLSANNDGSVNLVDPASFLDNGNAIDSKYQTGYHEEEGVLQIGGIGLNARGSGDLIVSVLKDQTKRKTITRTLPQVGALMGEVIKTTGQSPWWALEFSNGNNAGSWFEVTRCDLYVRTIYKTRRTSGSSSQSSFSSDSPSDSEVDSPSNTSPSDDDSESDCNCDDIPQLLNGLHADRPSAQLYPENTRYIETDRNNAEYYVDYLTPCDATTGVWKLVVGRMIGTIRAVDEKPSDLTIYDIGFQFEASDFTRIYEWSGTSWHDAYGQTPRSIQQLITPPSESGWHLCDGSTNIAISLPNGSSTLFNVPNLLGSYVKYGSPYTGSIISATTPSITGTTSSSGVHDHPGSTATGDLPDHTHEFTPIGTNTGNLPNHWHEVDDEIDIGNPVKLVGGDWTVNLGFTGSAVVTDHTHSLSSLDFTGTTEFENQTHTHTVADSVDFVNTTSPGTGGGTPFLTSVSGSFFTTSSTEDESHDHDFSVSFSGFSTAGIDGGPPAIDLTGLTVGPSDVSDWKHIHGAEGTTKGILDASGGTDPVPISMTFSGDSGETEGVTSGPLPIDINLIIASDGAHTHGSGSLVAGPSEPQHMILLPYFKL